MKVLIVVDQNSINNKTGPNPKEVVCMGNLDAINFVQLEIGRKLYKANFIDTLLPLLVFGSMESVATLEGLFDLSDL